MSLFSTVFLVVRCLLWTDLNSLFALTDSVHSGDRQKLFRKERKSSGFFIASILLHFHSSIHNNETENICAVKYCGFRGLITELKMKIQSQHSVNFHDNTHKTGHRVPGWILFKNLSPLNDDTIVRDFQPLSPRKAVSLLKTCWLASKFLRCFASGILKDLRQEQCNLPALPNNHTR